MGTSVRLWTASLTSDIECPAYPAANSTRDQRQRGNNGRAQNARGAFAQTVDRGRGHDRGRDRDGRHARGSASSEFYSQNAPRRTVPPRPCHRVNATGRAFLAARARNSIDFTRGPPYHELRLAFRRIPGEPVTHGPRIAPR